DHSAQLVGIADALGDPPFGLVHCLSAFDFSIFAFWLIGRYGLSTLELWVRLSPFGDSCNTLGDPQRPCFVSQLKYLKLNKTQVQQFKKNVSNSTTKDSIMNVHTRLNLLMQRSIVYSKTKVVTHH
ncbi:hypothetical protein H5410_021523, partial [Solanum commersonii]